MARKIKKVNKEVLEELVRKCLLHIGMEPSDQECNLFLRLFIGAISDYFFRFPDNEVEVGFVKFKKNPEKRELFAIELMPHEEVGVVNAKTLYEYYTGDLTSKEVLKEAMNNFVNELLAYSQVQSNKITTLTSRMQERRNENGI